MSRADEVFEAELVRRHVGPLVELEEALLGDETLARDPDLGRGRGAQVAQPACPLAPAGGDDRLAAGRVPA